MSLVHYRVLSDIRNLKQFDHRVLQDGHDLMAAYFRFILCPRESSIPIPEGLNLKNYYLAAWKTYYLKETGVLGG